MKIVFGSFVLLAFFLFSSCSKEADSGRNEPVIHDSTLVKELIKVDTVRTPGQDTLVKNQFVYDSKDRLAKVLVLGYGLNPLPSNIFELEYVYSGNDTLPGKYINKYWSDINRYSSSLPDYADTLYLFYAGNRIIKDSLFYHTSTNIAVVTTFTETNTDQFRVQIKEVYRSGAFYSDRGTFRIHIVRQGGNIIEMRDTIPFFGGPQARKINFTFDNRINPLKKTSLNFPFYRNYYFDGYVPDFIPYFLTDNNSNNILSMTRHYSATTSTSFQYKYDYFNTGLPSMLRTIGVRGYNEIFRY